MGKRWCSTFILKSLAMMMFFISSWMMMRRWRWHRMVPRRLEFNRNLLESGFVGCIHLFTSSLSINSKLRLFSFSGLISVSVTLGFLSVNLLTVNISLNEFGKVCSLLISSNVLHLIFLIIF